jgi:N-acetylmuramoyl-L-alanine amidase
MIVMHFTDGPSAQGAINRFLNPHEQVSAHYIIERDGTIFQMVRDSDKAWHAKDANSRSIGIEHVAVEGQQMAPAQETSSAALLKWLMATYDIKRSGIVGHLCVPRTPSVLITWDRMPNVSGDDRSVLPLPGPVRLAVQVEEPT